MSPQHMMSIDRLMNMSQANGHHKGHITLTFKLVPHDNNTFIGEVINTTGLKPEEQQAYDNEGALYYVLAVIFMYGCSILLMFGSFIKKSKHDNHITTYMKELERIGKLELKQEKFKTKLKMHQKKIHRILGPDRAEVVDDSSFTEPSPTPTPSTVYDGDVFTWDSPWLQTNMGSRRPSSVSIATTIVSSHDLQDNNLTFKGQGESEMSPMLLSAPQSPAFARLSPRLERAQSSSQLTFNSSTPSSTEIQNTPGHLSVPQVRIHMCN